MAGEPDPQRPGIFYLCPDHDTPVGGIRMIYRHVALLRSLGLNAFVLHSTPGFRCSWFSSDAPVVAAPLRPMTADDVLVVPEVYGPDLHEVCPATPKVIFNQNACLTFTGWPVPGSDAANPTPPYRSESVVAVITVSDHDADYVRHAFPGTAVHRVFYSVESVGERAKEDVILFMPRKNLDHARQVLNLLASRDAFAGFDVRAVDGMDHSTVLELLSRARVFLSFGYPEGFGLPAAEALAAGCLVIGYDGGGGREFLTEATGVPVSFGAILEFVRAVEDALARLRSDPGDLEARVRSGQALVRSVYTVAAEQQSLQDAWTAILEELGNDSVRLDAPIESRGREAWLVPDAPDAEILRLPEPEDAEADRGRELLDAQITWLHDQHEAARGELRRIRSTLSWRITKPLRSARKRLRRSVDDRAD